MSSENKKFDFTVENLGECKIKSPIELSTVVGNGTANYVQDSSFVRTAVNVMTLQKTTRLILQTLCKKQVRVNIFISLQTK